ncbi:MAG: hypothetical protein Q8M02_06720 [Candidatus Didemnitutus sp.]|nr:hypothetical protein [Candidatus Didemnitutus sp.]
MPPRPTDLSRTTKRNIGLITAGALALYLFMRWLPVGTDLNHMDFRAGEEKGAIEFCDPNSPQFIPVLAVRSPVQLTLRSDVELSIGRPTEFTLTMTTANGKPIGPVDLLVAHTRKLHLLVVDPTLNDYQHVHPEPGRKAGEWVFSLTPSRSGTYRVFADFMPVATGRGLYASTDFVVPGEVARVTRGTNTLWQAAGFNFELRVPAYFRAGIPAELQFVIESPGEVKIPVPMQPIMGAFAHLVAFDEARTGFAHLHPEQSDLAQPPEQLRPTLAFKVTIPQPGRYVIWAQVNLGGKEIFAPFWIEVYP